MTVERTTLRMRRGWWWWPALLMGMLVAGCAATPQTWYKAGGSQREFDIDSRECEIIARRQAIAATARHRHYRPETYAELYDRCLARMGWSRTPPATAASKTDSLPPPPSLGTRTDDTIHAFDTVFAVPANASLVTSNRRVVGPTTIESWLFQVPEDTYVNFILQQSETAAFPLRDYPVPPPYRLYTSGRGDGLRWAAFWGRVNGAWIKVIGAYGFYGRHRRLVVVITAPLAGPTGPPPPGLALAANQHHEMAAFVERWRPWLTNLAPRPGIVKRALQALGHSLKRF